MPFHKWSLIAHLFQKTCQKTETAINETSVWDLIFSEWCGWAFKSSGTWHCIAGCYLLFQVHHNLMLFTPV